MTDCLPPFLSPIWCFQIHSKDFLATSRSKQFSIEEMQPKTFYAQSTSYYHANVRGPLRTNTHCTHAESAADKTPHLNASHWGIFTKLSAIFTSTSWSISTVPSIAGTAITAHSVSTGRIAVTQVCSIRAFILVYAEFGKNGIVALCLYRALWPKQHLFRGLFFSQEKASPRCCVNPVIGFGVQRY